MICNYCGKHFNATSHEKYCSDTCRNLAHKQKKHSWYISNKQKTHTNTTTCRYCGKAFIKTHGNQKYCSKTCSDNMIREQNSTAALKYYYRRRKTRGGDKAWGLGSGGLGAHMHPNYTIELEKIENEMKRLRLTF